jgi:hypothetical protein
MKKTIILAAFILLLLSTRSTAQIGHILVLVGKNDAIITYYLDSLNRLRPNTMFKIKRDVAPDGDLLLQADYGLKDEPFFGCFSLMFRFTRVSGNEICGRELIIGSAEYAQRNLNFVKDNFTSAQAGTWEHSMTDSSFWLWLPLQSKKVKIRPFQ